MKKFTFAIVAILFLTGLGVRAATECYTKTHPPTEVFYMDIIVAQTEHPSDVSLSAVKVVVINLAEIQTAVTIRKQNDVLQRRSHVLTARSTLGTDSNSVFDNKPPNSKMLSFTNRISTKSGWCGKDSVMFNS